jgi:hypothetical protein
LGNEESLAQRQKRLPAAPYLHHDGASGARLVLGMVRLCSPAVELPAQYIDFK